MTGIDLVTGGSGFIGSHLVDALLARGRQVRVLDLVSPRQTDVELVEGSILNGDVVAESVAGAQRVFHVAGDPSLWARGQDHFDQANRTGAETVLDAAVAAGAERIILTSSHAIDVRSATQNRYSAMPGPYTRAKLKAEQYALKLVGEGAPVIAVAPTMPLGPGDRNLTPPSRMLLEFLQGRNPAFYEFMINLIDVREVAEGHVLAAEKGEVGVRYVLGRHNLLMSEFLAEVEEVSGQRMPRRTIPYALAWASASVMELAATVTRRPPRASVEGVRLAKHLKRVPDDPAEALGLAEWPLQPMLCEAIAWLEEEGHWNRG